jgi:hypothetical protein
MYAQEQMVWLLSHQGRQLQTKERTKPDAQAPFVLQTNLAMKGMGLEDTADKEGKASKVINKNDMIART